MSTAIAKLAPVIYGNGPHKAIVMNGWMGSASHWQTMLDAMDLSQVHIAVFEYRGYGTRRDDAGRFTFKEAAEDVIGLADKLRWDKFALIGQSMGGMAIQRVALTAPDRIEGILGLAPVSAAGSGMDATRLAMFEPAANDAAARNKIIQFSTGQRLTQAWSQSIAEDASDHLPEAMLGYLREWAVDGFVPEVEALSSRKIPVKVMVGEHDPSINLALAERTWHVHYPYADIEVIGNAAHYPMQEAPLAVAAKVQAWLLSLKTAKV